MLGNISKGEGHVVEHQSASKIFALIRFVRFGIKITRKTMEYLIHGWYLKFSGSF